MVKPGHPQDPPGSAAWWVDIGKGWYKEQTIHVSYGPPWIPKRLRIELRDAMGIRMALDPQKSHSDSGIFLNLKCEIGLNRMQHRD